MRGGKAGHNIQQGVHFTAFKFQEYKTLLPSHHTVSNRAGIYGIYEDQEQHSTAEKLL